MNWLKRLFGSGSTSASVSSHPKPAVPDATLPTIEEMNRIISALGQLMEKGAGLGLAVHDETMLPGDKSRIEFVLFCAIGIASDDHQARMLSAAMLHLANYQPNVGSEPITQLPTLPSPSSMTSPEGIRAAAAAIAAHASTSRYSQFEDQIQRDLTRLKSLADRALAERAARLAKRSTR